LVLASFLLIALILALIIFENFLSTFPETFLTILEILKSLALAALSALLIAALLAFGALRSCFLKAATFF
jgi:hypothetical protein